MCAFSLGSFGGSAENLGAVLATIGMSSPPAVGMLSSSSSTFTLPLPTPKRILIVGAAGQLGRAMADYFANRHDVIPLDRRNLDLANTSEIEPTLSPLDFDLLINTSAITNVDGCEANPELARVINSEVPAALAKICHSRGVKMVHIGTDYVFGGDADTPYDEESIPNPQSVYGRTKLGGEIAVLESEADALVVRTSLLYSARRQGFPDWVLQKAIESDLPISVVSDRFANLTNAESLPLLLEQLLAKPDISAGLYHVVNPGCASPAEQARFILQRASEYQIPIRTKEVRDVTMDSISAGRAPRPRYSILSVNKFVAATGKRPAAWQIALDGYLELVSPRHSTSASCS